MTVGSDTRERATSRPSWSALGRLGLLGFAVQAVAELVAWVLVDDSAGRSWSNGDFQEWAIFTAASTVLLVALGSLVTRRWRTALAVAAGCLLATVLGCAMFIGYALANSA